MRGSIARRPSALKKIKGKSKRGLRLNARFGPPRRSVKKKGPATMKGGLGGGKKNRRGGAIPQDEVMRRKKKIDGGV